MIKLYISSSTLKHSLKQLYLGVFILLVLLTNSSHVNSQEMLNSKAELEQALIKHRGEVVYIDFWASWCGPCRKSFPWMNKIQSQYQSQGFTIISINLDADKNLANKFLLETPANFAVIYDPKGKIAKHFKIQGMPSSMLIGRDGKIKSRHTGFFTNKISTYEQEIEELLTTHNE